MDAMSRYDRRSTRQRLVVAGKDVGEALLGICALLALGFAIYSAIAALLPPAALFAFAVLLSPVAFWGLGKLIEWHARRCRRRDEPWLD